MDIDTIPVISVSYNSAELIEDLLGSFRAHYSNPVTIIDGSGEQHYRAIEAVCAKYADVRFIHFDYNIHHGPGGMAWAFQNLDLKGRVLVLDSDIQVIRGGFLEDMAARLKPGMYGVGYVNHVNEGGFDVKYEEGAVRYLHPACMLLNMDVVHQWPMPTKHGAPMTEAMLALRRAGRSDLVQGIDWLRNDFLAIETNEPRLYLRHDWQGHGQAQRQLQPGGMERGRAVGGRGAAQRDGHAAAGGTQHRRAGRQRRHAGHRLRPGRSAAALRQRRRPSGQGDQGRSRRAGRRVLPRPRRHRLLDTGPGAGTQRRSEAAAGAPAQGAEGGRQRHHRDTERAALEHAAAAGGGGFEVCGPRPAERGQRHWFSRGSLLNLLNETGYKMEQGVPLTRQPLTNPLLEATWKQLFSALGADPVLAFQDSQPDTYVLKARLA